jgi:hypothetical protein
MAEEMPMLTDQLTTEALGVLLHAAGAAQIVHIAPQWRIEVNGHLIDVYLDGVHLLPAADPTARALRISAGAAVFNLRCAAASLSFDSWVSLCPYPYDPGLVARIVIEYTGAPDQELRQLYGAILSRHLSRPPGIPDEPLRIALSRAAELEDARLDWRLVASAPLAVLSTAGDGRRDHLQLGLARQRVLLTAAKHDIQATCLNQTLIRFGRSGCAPAGTDAR